MKITDLPPSLILMPSMLNLIRSHDPEVDVLLAASHIFRYPDGSVQLNDADLIHAASSLMTAALRREAERPIYSSPNSLLTGGTFFRGWAESPFRYYTVHFWDALVHDLEDSNWVVVMGWNPDSWREIKTLACSEITVRFRRRINQSVMEQFALMLRDWLDSKGLAGEGAVSLIEQKVHFIGRQARFRVDASATGQKTMNWLILSFLHLASKATITDIDVWGFSSADDRFGVPKGRSTWIDVPPA